MKLKPGALGTTKVQLIEMGDEVGLLIEDKHTPPKDYSTNWVDSHGHKHSVVWHSNKWFNFKRIKENEIVLLLEEFTEEKQCCYVLIKNVKYLVDKDLILWRQNNDSH